MSEATQTKAVCSDSPRLLGGVMTRACTEPGDIYRPTGTAMYTKNNKSLETHEFWGLVLTGITLHRSLVRGALSIQTLHNPTHAIPSTDTRCAAAVSFPQRKSHAHFLWDIRHFMNDV